MPYDKIKEELKRSIILHGDFKSLKDAEGIIWEEFDELIAETRKVKFQDNITRYGKDSIKEEAIQLAAMCVKLINYIG